MSETVDDSQDIYVEEQSIRPAVIDEFIGQKRLRDNLSVAIQGSKARNTVMDHVVFFGPPGLGKTTLSQIVARELGVGFRSTSGPVIAKSGDLAALLTNLQPNDVLFIDEIHRLNPAVEEILYPAMEDFQLDIIIGEGPSARSVKIDLPPFTLVGATTRMGLLTTPLRDRFGIQMRLNFYEVEDLKKIVIRSAHIFGIAVSDDGAMEIAKRSRGTPRIAGRLLRRVYDFALVAKQEIIDLNITNIALEALDVDRLGLDAMDRKYMAMIGEHYRGGPVGIDTISAGLSEQKDTLEEVIEPYLIQQGLLNRTPRGRMITEKAFKHLNIPIPKHILEFNNTKQINLFNTEDNKEN